MTDKPLNLSASDFWAATIEKIPFEMETDEITITDFIKMVADAGKKIKKEGANRILAGMEERGEITSRKAIDPRSSKECRAYKPKGGQ
jgi:hypothetical protein